MLKWNAIYKKISLLDNSNLDVGAAAVLNQTENEGKRLSKWELSRVVKELRKFRRFKLALEVVCVCARARARLLACLRALFCTEIG